MKIGNFNLNTDGTYIIAEPSANHNGSLQIALDTIKAAIRDTEELLGKVDYSMTKMKQNLVNLGEAFM